MKDDAAPALTPELMLAAYAQGLFPMAEHQDDPELFWVNPTWRGIVPLDRFHVSRSLARQIRRGGFTVTINRRFAQVVDGCRERDVTWINPVLARTYLALHARGHAHSVEVEMGGKLVGGIFGLTLGGAFFGESMFSRATGGSKIAMTYLVWRLRTAGFTLFDAQFITDHLRSLGAEEISRGDYHRRLAAALRLDCDFTAPPAMPPVQELLQPRTQRS